VHSQPGGRLVVDRRLDRAASRVSGGMMVI
jgi:hypothetical protein